MENTFAYPFSEGAAFCQGPATDGTYYYGTGCIKYFHYLDVRVASKTVISIYSLH